MKRLSLVGIVLLLVFAVWQIMLVGGSDIDFVDIATIAGLVVGIVALVPSGRGEVVRVSGIVTEESGSGLNLSGVIVGGVLGGSLSGFAFSISYRSLDPDVLDSLVAIPEITLALAIAFTALVVATRLGVVLVRSQHPPGGVHWLFQKEVRGSLLGCVTAGLVVGIPLGWHFGQYKETRPFTPPEYLIATLVPGCVIATMLFVLAEEAPGRGAARKVFCVGVLSAAIWGTFGYATSEALKLESVFRNLMYADGDQIWHLIGGSLYGGFVAAFLGLTMGSSSMLAKLWINGERRRNPPPVLDREVRRSAASGRGQ